MKATVKRYSSRGTDILNYIEGYSRPKKVSKQPFSGHVSNKQKLLALIAKNPDNTFYKSLAERLSKAPLTPNHIRCIAKAYGMTFGNRHSIPCMPLIGGR